MITLDPPRPCTAHPAGTRAGAEFRKSLRRPRRRETGQATGPLRSAFDHKRYADPYTDVTLDVRHLKTARWQQRPLLGFLRRPPDPEDLLHAGSDRHLAVSRRILRCALGIHGTLWVTPSTIPGMLLRDADNSIWFGFKGDAHVLALSMHAGPLFDAGWEDPCDRGDGGWRMAFLG